MNISTTVLYKHCSFEHLNVKDSTEDVMVTNMLIESVWQKLYF